MLDDDLPQRQEPDPDVRDVDDPRPERSLTDDISALIEDGKTYAEAELAYQKTRLSYAADKGKSGLGLGLAALAFIHLSLVALVVGLVIALTPYLTALGATGVVAGVLLIGAAIFGLTARKRFGSISKAFEEDGQ